MEHVVLAQKTPVAESILPFQGPEFQTIVVPPKPKAKNVDSQLAEGTPTRRSSVAIHGPSKV